MVFATGIEDPAPKIRDRLSGFTLIEVMVALAILGASLMLLLDVHYKASQLYDEAQGAVLMQSFLERAVGEAEIAARTGLQSGAGEFGDEYPGYAFRWQATPYGPVEGIPLLQLDATVKGPLEERTVSVVIYLTEENPGRR